MNTTTRSQAEEKKHFNWLPLAFLVAIIGIIPMIVYMKIVTYEGISHQIYGKTSDGNFFSYYKSIWLYIFTASAMLWFLVNRKVQPCWYHKPLVIYGFLATLSTVFSQYPQMAIWGDPCRHEGLLAHLCYMAIVFLFINLIQSKRDLKFVLTSLIASATILALLGALQFGGYNYFSNQFAEQLLVPTQLQKTIPDLDLNKMSDGSRFVFLTFGNGNFTGSYMAMLFTLTLVLTIACSKNMRFLLVPINIILFINLLGSKSRAGLLGALTASFVAMIFMRGSIKANMKFVSILLLTYCLIPFAMDAYTWQNGLPRFFATSIARSIDMKSGMFGNFQSLNLASETATVVFDGVQTQIRFNDDQLEFYDHNGELTPYSLLPNPNLRTTPNPMASFSTLVSGKPVFATVGKISAASKDVDSYDQTTPTEDIKAVMSARSKEYLVVFPDKKLLGFMFYVWPNHGVLEIGRGGVSFFIKRIENGFKLLNQFGRPVELTEVEAIGFKGRERFAGNRGYIWSRTLPMLKNARLIGYGPDTFAAHFPNHDYIGKLKVWGGGIYTMIEKPHDLYLQIAVNSGILSLLAALSLFVCYLLESAKIYWRSNFSQMTDFAGVAITAAVTAYLIAGIFNDSVVGVAPVFWGLLGLGIATNRINTKMGQKSQVEIQLASQIISETKPN